MGLHPYMLRDLPALRVQGSFPAAPLAGVSRARAAGRAVLRGIKK